MLLGYFSKMFIVACWPTPTVRCTALFGRARIVRLSLRISVDPLILCQGKPVDLKVEVMRGGQRHPPQRGSLVGFHLAFLSRDREVVKLSELR